MLLSLSSFDANMIGNRLSPPTRAARSTSAPDRRAACQSRISISTVERVSARVRLMPSSNSVH